MINSNSKMLNQKTIKLFNHQKKKLKKVKLKRKKKLMKLLIQLLRIKMVPNVINAINATNATDASPIAINIFHAHVQDAHIEDALSDLVKRLYISA